MIAPLFNNRFVQNSILLTSTSISFWALIYLLTKSDEESFIFGFIDISTMVTFYLSVDIFDIRIPRHINPNVILGAISVFEWNIFAIFLAFKNVRVELKMLFTAAIGIFLVVLSLGVISFVVTMIDQFGKDQEIEKQIQRGTVIIHELSKSKKEFKNENELRTYLQKYIRVEDCANSGYVVHCHGENWSVSSALDNKRPAFIMFHIDGNLGFGTNRFYNWETKNWEFHEH